MHNHTRSFHNIQSHQFDNFKVLIFLLVETDVDVTMEQEEFSQFYEQANNKQHK